MSSRIALLTLVSAVALAQAPDSAREENEQYFRQVMTAVRRNYELTNALPEWRASVTLRIGPAGELLEANLTKSSGSEVFDTLVLGSVKKAAPFPAPPERLRDDLKKKGIAIVFRP